MTIIQRKRSNIFISIKPQRRSVPSHHGMVDREKELDLDLDMVTPQKALKVLIRLNQKRRNRQFQRSNGAVLIGKGEGEEGATGLESSGDGGERGYERRAEEVETERGDVGEGFPCVAP